MPMKEFLYNDGHRPSVTFGFYGYDVLLVIARGRILHRFRDNSFRHVQRRYLWLPLLRLSPDGDVLMGKSL